MRDGITYFCASSGYSGVLSGFVKLSYTHFVPSDLTEINAFRQERQ